MQGKKNYHEKLFTNFQLSERVPEENFYRRLKSQLDLHFLYKLTETYYGTEGQKSIDPVVFFKLILVGYLENLNSDRKIIAHASLRLDIIFFIDHDIEEELPWHSTLSRTRELYGEEVFKTLFKKVLSLCVSKGMVGGKRQAIDSAFIKANASMDSLKEKRVLSAMEAEVLADAEAYSDELKANDASATLSAGTSATLSAGTTITAQKQKEVERHHKWKAEAYKGQPTGRKKTSEDSFEDEKGNDENKRAKFLSNDTHYSSTDPDARISVKPGKPRQFNYSAQTSVDTKGHVITNILADFSDKRDSQSLPQAVDQTIENLKENDLKLEEVLADTGYSSGTALRYLKENNITGYIPNFGQYKPTRQGFVYDKENDHYVCSRGKVLKYTGTSTDRRGYETKNWLSKSNDCKDCPLRAQCIGKSKTKRITESADKPLYDEMHIRLQTRKAKHLKKQRSSTVEPVLGTLINFTGMRRIWTRGIKNANKFMLGAAIAYNIKKWLNYKQKKVNIQVNELQKPEKRTKQSILNCFFTFSAT